MDQLYTVLEIHVSATTQGIHITGGVTFHLSQIPDSHMAITDSIDRHFVLKAQKFFYDTFGESPTVAAAAPGRVNLIGEHVDYNDGFVFPLALLKSTYIVARPQPTDNNQCQVISDAFPNEVATFTPGDSPLEPSTPKWASYLKGMTAIYVRNNLKVIPFKAAIVSSVPRGGGLSSSAALEMATAVTIEILGELDVDANHRAQMGQSCEHEFVGVPCGIMDQLISSRACEGRALLIDCRSLGVTSIPLNHPDAVIVIADSRVSHELSGSEYSSRRNQCYSVAEAIAKHFSETKVTHLRDCTLEMLRTVEESLDEQTVKRARHVIEEDKRTLRAKKYLEEGDLSEVGKLMYQSHKSLRDLFEVSTKEIDALVDIAMSVQGVYGSRITGGGFGGCTVTLVHKDSVDALTKAFHEHYPRHSGGLHATVFSTTPGPGARDLTSFLSE